MEDRLTVLAEISVALAGFSSVVVAFRRRSADGAWRPEDIFRFKLMLRSGLMAGFFALLPAALEGIGVGAATRWPLVSTLLFLYLLRDLMFALTSARRLPARSLDPIVGYSVLTTAFATTCVLALSLAGWIVPKGPGPYVFGVTWLTVYSGISFYRLVSIPIEADAHGHAKKG